MEERYRSRLRVYAAAGLTALVLMACSPGASEISGGSLGAAMIGKVKHGDLLRAVASGNADRAAALLKAGADINESVGEAEQKLTPLLVAVATGNSQITELLIRNGAAKEPRFMGYTARDFVIYLGDEKSAAFMNE